MKTKKILTMISAVAMAATMGATTLAGCNSDKHTHNYVFETDYEATCDRPGQRTGTCSSCGDVKAEAIPVDPDAHEFDSDWNVTQPTETTEGRATRTCKLNSAHTFDVTLPKLGEKDKYNSVDDVELPSYIAAGIRRYVLFHSAGDIEFDVELPKHDTIEDLRDVVLYASTLNGNIRRSEGNYVEGDPNGTDVRANAFYNYYGDNYTLVHDGGNRRDFWYSRDDDGKPFGISAELNANGNPYDPRVDESVTENNLKGYGYSSGGGMKATYGAEDTLLTYFEASKSENAIKYEEKTYSKQSDGSYVCAFEFSRMEDVHFCRYYVDFVTYPTGEIKTLNVKTKIIRSWMLANTFDGTNTGEVIYGEDGDVIFSEIYPINSEGVESYETNYVYEKDASGNVIYDPVYEYETLENGNIKYDDEGDPVIKKDEQGNPVTVKDKDGKVKTEPRKTYTYQYTYKWIYQTDAQGKPVLDEEGQPIIKEDENGNPLYEKDENGDAVMVIAKDVNGAKIKTPVVGDPAIVIDGYKQKPDGTPLLDRNGNQIARPVPEGFSEGDTRKYYYEEGDNKPGGGVYDEDHPYIVIRNISFTQTLKVAGEQVEENPYPAESVYIHSFDISYDNQLISEGDVVEISANTPAIFKISNVQPSDTAKLEFDPLSVYLQAPTGEIALGATADNVYHIIGHFRRGENEVLINAQHSGEITIVLRTLSGRCERELKLNIAKGVPTALNAQAYLYSDAGGSETHTWTSTEYSYANPESALTIYEGQSLYIRGTAIASEASYVDASFVTELDTGETTSPYISLEDGLELADGTKVSKITALAATDEPVGVYVNSIYTNSSGHPAAYKLIGINVIAAPSVDDMFTGSYTGKFGFINMVENGAPVAADVTVTFTPESATAGTMAVSVTDGKSTVNCVYGYTYDAETREFTGTYVSGRNDDTFKFTFALNEAYKLTIHHLTFPDRGRSETIVLSRPQSN